jgi:hypothetical protein
MSAACGGSEYDYRPSGRNAYHELRASLVTRATLVTDHWYYTLLGINPYSIEMRSNSTYKRVT